MAARNPRRRGARWQARYMGADGREHSRTFDTKTEADRFLTSVRAQLQTGDWIDPTAGRVTFGQWFDAWWRVRLIDVTTAASQESMARVHVLPRFGRQPIGSITGHDVRTWVAGLTGEGLAPATVGKCYQLLAGAMAAAVEERLIRSSPCRGVRLPRVDPAEPAFMSTEQVSRLAGAMPDRYRALIVLAYMSGLRWSELAGLRVRRLDMLRRRLDVVEVAKEVGGHITFGAPKSRASRRTVTLNEGTVEALAAHLAAYPAGPDDLVFTGSRGTPLSRTRFRARVWQPAMTAAGLDELRPRPTFHSLRHSHAAALIADRTPMKAVQARLGHASMRITYDTYGHLEEQLDTELLAGLERRAQTFGL